MNIINRITDENVLVLSASGRIDSNNATLFEAGLMAQLDMHPGLSVEFDASGIEYISSAGLRVFLKMHKKLKGNLVIDNVKNEVYSIFETTGFTRMIDVRRGMRNIGSVLRLKPLGVSFNGRSYKLSEDELVKVYKSSVDLSEIQKERELAQEAMILGVPTAIPYDVVKCGDQNYYGVIFEAMKSADSMAEVISKDRSKLEPLARRLGALVRELHSLNPDKDVFPNIKERYKGWINMAGNKLPADKKRDMRALIEAMPESDTYVHGDIRIDNVMVLGDELILTDMSESGYGHRIFDLQGLYASLIEMEKETPYYTSTNYGLSQDDCRRIWEVFYKEYMGDTDMASYGKMNDLLKKYYKLTQTLSGVI